MLTDIILEGRHKCYMICLMLGATKSSWISMPTKARTSYEMLTQATLFLKREIGIKVA